MDLAGNDRADRILLVDDEPNVRKILAEYLRTEGFEVSEAADGAAALERARIDRPDLIILDLNLPKLSGSEVFRRLRAVENTPVIMLTARVNELDRVVGLELGADDYIGKPFSPREVVARVKTVLRRYRGAFQPAAEPARQRIGNLEIDRTGHEALLDGKRVSLTPTEFRILDLLASNIGRAFTRDQILDKISNEQSDVFDRTLDRHIANLRHKIEADPSRPHFVLTVFGVGYKMASE